MNKKLNQELYYIKETIKYYISRGSYSVEEIHQIRLTTRRLLSLLHHKNLQSKELKKIIKLSNKIRDIDVFMEEYLTKLPPKYQKDINTPIIRAIFDKKRDRYINKFVKYLEKFLTKKKMKFIKSNRDNKLVDEPKLTKDIKQLHRYRIYIKNRLYLEKEKKEREILRVVLLDKVKDLLGKINDNYNALKLIKKLNLEDIGFKAISNYTKKENRDSFKDAKRLVLRLRLDQGNSI